jgi:hypothetical protein
MIHAPRSDDSFLHGRQAGYLPNRPAEEHAAVLQEAAEYDLLYREDDLFDEGVSVVFGIRRAEAELQSFWFDADRFAAEQAREWLLERGLKPISFRPASGDR